MSIFSLSPSDQPPAAPFAVATPRRHDDIGFALGSAFPSAGAVPPDMLAMLASLDCATKNQPPEA
ncbi:hypothetical protein [Sphingomonas sp. 28-63-12]|uniref:hypothetical protein n=1 Tax=Sphingomonas sp. 28-63-12 TaxID=1970434 RepID=UPI000BD9E26B|nr:MAG: hypothetical protein B7Y47_01660 [Sphingomonas sp. 28-63-12]